MALPPVLASIIGWLRAGYPEGVPEHDYIPLYALLSTRLTDADISEIADGLASAGDPASAKAIHAAITSVTHEHPLDTDIARVNARLAAVGWPSAAQSEPTS
jgi:hypothetical protein